MEIIRVEVITLKTKCEFNEFIFYVFDVHESAQKKKNRSNALVEALQSAV